MFKTPLLLSDQVMMECDIKVALPFCSVVINTLVHLTERILIIGSLLREEVVLCVARKPRAGE